MNASDQRFKEVRADLGDLRGELRALRTDMRADMQGLRTDMRADMHELRAEMITMHRHFDLILTGFAVGLLGLIGATQL